MELPTYVALSRLAAQQRALDVTASNLANASTPGFKASRVLFTDWLSSQTGTAAPAGDRKVSYTQDRATYRELQPGALQNTSNPLDLAISGEGYFTVGTLRGPRLTRAGHFTQQSNGTIGDMDGNALLSSSGAPLRIAPTDTAITVTADGTISTESGEIGRIGVVMPSDANRMTAEGSRNLRADVSTAPTTQPKIVQGAVEDSNVQSVVETTRMMSDLRSFQFTTQFVQAEADRMQSAIDRITARKP
ncbi:MAG: flagellar hook-basal body complex protein [Pseudomonadota bacterium]|nr:flagellar hook-basal body complex protein [Pseudomonadota bacterium]